MDHLSSLFYLESALFYWCPGDFFAVHSVSLGLHVTILILAKGGLDSRGTSLMFDKIMYRYAFSCDGPGRGGTCDISVWDAFYLASFWVLNTVAWLTFYFYWKSLGTWDNNLSQSFENSSHLNAWLCDYLWYNSATLINGYSSFGVNDVSVWSLMFSAAHLVWATGFMFLISWRGYWQELLGIILFLHLKTPLICTIWSTNLAIPVALSIVQARFIGLTHFTVGFIFSYASFLLGCG